MGKKKSAPFDIIDISFDIWPLVLVLILMLGVFYINFFYMFYFNFKIFSYLEISEIFIGAFVNLGSLDLFQKTIVYSLLLLVLFKAFVDILLGVVLPFLKLGIVFSFKLKRTYVKIRNWPTEWSDFFYKYVLFFWYMAAMIYLVYDYYFHFSPFKKYHPDGIGFFGLWVILFTKVLRGTFRDFVSNKNDEKVPLFKYVLIFAITVFVVSTRIRHDAIVKGHYTYGTKIYFEKDSIVSDSQFYYVDKTKGYIFMWNVKDTAMTVIPMNDVKKLLIHNGVPDKALEIKYNSIVKKDSIDLLIPQKNIKNDKER